MYSIPGFDPCYPLDFSQQQTIKFLINCRFFDETNSVNVKSENVGYEYRDVIDAPMNPGNFEYIAHNPRFNYKMIKQTDMKVIFNMFNWKWLSQIYSSPVDITDPDVQAGLKEAEIAIDFPFLEK
jgi:hypothetical protein